MAAKNRRGRPAPDHAADHPPHHRTERRRTRPADLARHRRPPRHAAALAGHARIGHFHCRTGGKIHRARAAFFPRRLECFRLPRRRRRPAAERRRVLRRPLAARLARAAPDQPYAAAAPHCRCDSAGRARHRRDCQADGDSILCRRGDGDHALRRTLP